MPLSSRPPAAPIGKVKAVRAGGSKRRRKSSRRAKSAGRRKAGAKRSGKRKMTAKQARYFGKKRKSRKR